MRKIIRDRWIQALKSGEYKQGKSTLETWDEKYCCLGVLCKTMFPNQDICGLAYIPNEIIKENPKLSLSRNFRISISKEKLNRLQKNSRKFREIYRKIPWDFLFIANGIDSEENSSNYQKFKELNSIKLPPMDKLNDQFELSFKEIAYLLEVADKIIAID